MADSGRRWNYRGEGNCSLVLADSSEKKVYRIPKIQSSKYDIEAEHSSRKEYLQKQADNIYLSLQKSKEYTRNVMAPLLTSNYVVIPEVRRLPDGFAKKAEFTVSSHRPERRKSCKLDCVHPAAKSAIVLPDFCFVKNSNLPVFPYRSTLSVEIKPKKSFIPLSPYISDVNSVKCEVCKFCLHKQLKVKEGKWPRTSNYCPLDLHSGDRQRMKHALLELCENPQNNLKLCLDGKEVYGSSRQENLTKILQKFFGTNQNHIRNGKLLSSELNCFFNLLVEALLAVPKDFKLPDYVPSESHQNRIPHCTNSKYHSQSEKELVNNPLPRGCVLERTMAVQLLDEYDIEGIYPLYQKLNKHLECHPNDWEKWQLDGPYTPDVWSFESECPTEPCYCSKLTLSEPICDNCIKNALNRVRRFLVSKTAQDCSIMVALQHVDGSMHKPGHSDQILYDDFGKKYTYSIAVIDLDPKPYHKIATYLKQESKIILTYKDSLISNEQENIAPNV